MHRKSKDFLFFMFQVEENKVFRVFLLQKQKK